MNPNVCSGTSQTFTFKYSSMNGFSYLNTIYALMNGGLSAANGCMALYLAGATRYICLTTRTGGFDHARRSRNADQQPVHDQWSNLIRYGAGNQLSLVLAVTFKPLSTGLNVIRVRDG